MLWGIVSCAVATFVLLCVGVTVTYTAWEEAPKTRGWRVRYLDSVGLLIATACLLGGSCFGLTEWVGHYQDPHRRALVVEHNAEKSHCQSINGLWTGDVSSYDNYVNNRCYIPAPPYRVK